MINSRKLLLLLSATLLVASIMPNTSHAQASSSQAVITTGLNGPRGLKFGPDGMLYVAEAGTGGTTSTVGLCEQVPAPVGPYKGGTTGRISRIDKSGKRTTVASGFASSVDALGDLQGVADLAFVDGTLYAVIAGGGCSHGVKGLPNAVVSVNTKNGSWKQVANLSQFLKSHPVKYSNPLDFEPDGTFYSMIAYHDQLYTVEPNHGQVLLVNRDGDVHSLIDVSASQGHIVPTAITERDGEFFLGNLNIFPIEPNFARILTLSHAECSQLFIPGLQEEGGTLHVVSSKAGFTTVVGTEFGPDGLLYVLELSDAPGNPGPGNGKVVRVRHDGTIEDVATGLSVPTAMTFGPDDKLYVSNFGAAPAGMGQIVRITIW
jgi:glucose/arabinose dehydrogenase